ncbi:hypothetical protein B0H14DRAFT_2612430 [Mycena olivaceomarginata]|nr:hypothetical protein B0H14DRAFT_2612430 [Mycena olivaceomarginata]
MLATPGFKVIIAKVLSFLPGLEEPNLEAVLDCIYNFIGDFNFSNPANLSELMEGAGGTIDDLAGLYIRGICFSLRDTEPSLETEQQRSLPPLGAFHSILLYHGLVRALVAAMLSVSTTAGPETGFVLDECFMLLERILLASPGYLWIEEAMDAGLIQVIVSCATGTRIGQELVSTEEFQTCDISSHWGRFMSLANERLEFLAEFDSAEFVSPTACDNLAGSWTTVSWMIDLYIQRRTTWPQFSKCAVPERWTVQQKTHDQEAAPISQSKHLQQFEKVMTPPITFYTVNISWLAFNGTATPHELFFRQSLIPRNPKAPDPEMRQHCYSGTFDLAHLGLQFSPPGPKCDLVVDRLVLRLVRSGVQFDGAPPPLGTQVPDNSPTPEIFGRKTVRVFSPYRLDLVFDGPLSSPSMLANPLGRSKVVSIPSRWFDVTARNGKFGDYDFAIWTFEKGIDGTA